MLEPPTCHRPTADGLRLPNVLLVGASGFLGSNIHRVLEAAGHSVRALSRRHGVDVGALTRPADWSPHLAGIDAVINSVGIIGETRRQRFATLHARAPMALFDACVEAGVCRVIQVSALGADDTAFSAFHRSKRQADHHLRGLDVDWFVLRPSLVYGRGGASAGMFMRLARLPWLPVVGDGCQTVQPVHVSDVVATVLQCLRVTGARRTLDVVGPETLTFADWLQRMRLAQGLRPARLLRMPRALVMGLVHVASPFISLMQPVNVRMLEATRPACGRAVEEFLGRRLAPFSPSLLLRDESAAGPVTEGAR